AAARCASQQLLSDGRKAVCLLVLGMAGSGKTTFVQRLTAHLRSLQSPPYVINLDPAVRDLPFPANIGKAAPVAARRSPLAKRPPPFDVRPGRHSGHGQLQRGDEAVRPGTQRRHRHLAQPVCHAL
uniref:GPN-loop GTPase n=1 Tax=Hippocampus comes TaxID=109280 RepID=A0A3Q3DTN9_HIPCM